MLLFSSIDIVDNKSKRHILNIQILTRQLDIVNGKNNKKTTTTKKRKLHHFTEMATYTIIFALHRVFPLFLLFVLILLHLGRFRGKNMFNIPKVLLFQLTLSFKMFEN